MSKLRNLQRLDHTSCKSTCASTVPVQNKMYPVRNHFLCQCISIIYKKNFRTIFLLHSGNPLKISDYLFFTATGTDHYCNLNILLYFHFRAKNNIPEITSLLQSFHSNPDGRKFFRIRHFKRSRISLGDTFSFLVYSTFFSICITERYFAISGNRNLHMKPVQFGIL